MTNPQVWVRKGGSVDIFAGTVYAGQIAAGAIGTAELAAGSIVADKIAAGAVTAEAITAGSVTADAIAAGAVNADKIESNSIVAGNIAAGAIGVDQLAASGVTTDKLAALAVTADKIAAGTITADKIAAGTITAAQIAAGTITGSQIAASVSLSSPNITGGNISGVNITGTTITGGTITGGTIRTAASPNTRVELPASGSEVNFYNSSNAKVGYLKVYSNAAIALGYDSVNELIVANNGLFFGGNASITGELTAYKAISPATDWVSGTSDDGFWVQDANVISRRYKLYFDSSNGRLIMRRSSSVYSYFARSGGSSTI